MFSEITVGKLQHWLDTPLGEIYGYPHYGNNIEELLFINRQKSPTILNQIFNKLEKDLGIAVRQEITNAYILKDRQMIDTFTVVLILNNDVAIGEYHV